MLRHAASIVFLLLCCLPNVWAANLLVLFNESNPAHREFVSSLQTTLDGSNWKIQLAGRPENIESNRSDLVVAAGPDAFRQALSLNISPPVLATLITRPIYEKILADNPRTRRTSALFIEQPSARIVAFIKHLLPAPQKVGMLSHSENRGSIQQFRQLLLAAGQSLETEEIDREEQLIPTLNTLLSRSSLLLAPPDPRLYARDNIKAVLLTSYRQRRPVIGFSAAMTTAGALAAIYSSPAQIGQQAAELIQSLGSALPPPSYPSHFSISINRNVAEALEIEPTDEATLRRALSSNRDTR